MRLRLGLGVWVFGGGFVFLLLFKKIGVMRRKASVLVVEIANEEWSRRAEIPRMLCSLSSELLRNSELHDQRRLITTVIIVFVTRRFAPRICYIESVFERKTKLKIN